MCGGGAGEAGAGESRTRWAEIYPPALKGDVWGASGVAGAGRLDAGLGVGVGVLREKGKAFL